MVHPEFHNAVDALACRHAFVKRKYRLVDHWHQHAVGNKPRRVLTFERHLAELFCQLVYLFVRLVGSRGAANNLDQLHYRHRIHEVHSNSLVRPAGHRAKLSDRDRRSVRGQNCVGPGNTIQRFEHLSLNFEVLSDRFDHDESIAQRTDVRSGPDARHDRALFIRAQPFLIDITLEALFDCSHTARKKLLSHVAHHDVKSGARRNLSNARSHRSRSNYAEDFTHKSLESRL